MSPYKFHAQDRNYTEYSISDATTMEVFDISLTYIDELVGKSLFNGDIFEAIQTTDKGLIEINILHSCIRNVDSIPGVLVLEGNKTYGRKGKKFLYKCIPDDRRLPVFLVPYETRSGFSKVQINSYVTFKYKQWDNKHPQGNIANVLGNVSELDNFYEYQLYCKSLNASIQGFNRATSQALKNRTHDEFIETIWNKYPNIEDRTHYTNVFTIDSKTTCDFDDAISIQYTNGNTSYVLSVYIANVSIWLETLNLWKSFSKRISTIYLPDRKRPMLPTVLSDCLCSLQQNQTRFAFVMDLYVTDNEIQDVKFKNVAVKISKNYIYEEDALMKLKPYQQMLSNIQSLSKKHRFVSNVRNSYDVVTFMMICMNNQAAKTMNNYGNGIYRSATFTPNVQLPDDLPDNVYKFMNMWNNFSGQYCLNKPSEHKLLDLDSYLHITSPIRRLVDLLNMIQLQINLNIISFSDDVSEFYQNWISQIDYINTTMRAIRKVQSDCELLNLITHDTTMLDQVFEGYMFDKIIRNDGLYQYIVYLPELKMISRITSRVDKNNYEKANFKLYLFKQEERLKQKIRLQLYT